MAVTRFRASIAGGVGLVLVAFAPLGCQSLDRGLLDAPIAGAGVGGSQGSAGATGGTGGRATSSADGGGRGGTAVPLAPVDGGVDAAAAPVACVPNPDATDEVCPEVCPEACNGEDDDCDLRIDEAAADFACRGPYAAGECRAARCVIVACDGRHRDCDDDAKNGCETDGECNGKPCDAHAECASGFCRPSDDTCRTPTCGDGARNHEESDVDCGGPCDPCPTGKRCAGNADCVTDDCKSGKCYGVETCLDGKDDDGDGKVDCADGNCGAFECAPAVPPGWEGYFRLREGAFSPALDSVVCDDGKPPTRQLAAPVHIGQCAACSCGALSGATCGNQPVFCSTDGSCSVGTDFTANLVTGACYSPSSHRNANVRCWVGTTPVTALGSCTPSGGSVVPTDPWAELIDVCSGTGAGLAGGGCGANGACIPKSSDDYVAEGVCVRQAGTAANCPAGWGTPKHVFAGGTDNRGCSACACTPSTTCTGGQVCSEDANDCGGGGGCQPINDNSGCTNHDGYSEGTWSIHRTAWPSPSGSCAFTGGVPNGQIDTSGATTYCCQ